MNLNDLRHLENEIKLYSSMLEKLENVQADPERKREAVAALESIRLRCWLQLGELIELVKSIPDSDIRAAVMLRYAEGHTWQYVAFYMGYGSEASWRLSCKRYLEKYMPRYMEEKEGDG